jgi:hypothetical protein
MVRSEGGRKVARAIEFYNLDAKQDAEFVSDFDRVVTETKRLEGGDPPRTTGEGPKEPRPPAKADQGSTKKRRKR